MISGGIFDLPAKEQRLALLDTEMAAPAFWDDNRRAQDLIRERTEVARAVERVAELTRQASDLGVLVELAHETGDDGSLDAEIGEGVRRLRRELDEFELKVMLSGSHDARPAIVSIHPGAGGTESQDWAQMLMRMYLRWCERAGFKAEVVDLLPGEEAGIKSVTVRIVGPNAYGWLKSESGVHRLVRISPFDSQARRHTSFASVWVYPVVDESIEVEVHEKDLRIDTYRASGAGGQHVNKTDSAVRLTHLPTGIVVACQNDRSQHRNRAQAYAMLRARLYELELQKRREAAEAAAATKSDIGWGHQIRSYVLQPYQMVKDLRTGVENSSPDSVLGCDLNEFMEAVFAYQVDENRAKSVHDID